MTLQGGNLDVAEIILIVLLVLVLILLLTVTRFWLKLRADQVDRLTDLQERMLDREDGRAPLTRLVRVRPKPGEQVGISETDAQASAVMAAAATYELTEEFKKLPGGTNPPGTPPIAMCSLGEYLASLRAAPGTKLAGTPEALRKEMDALMAHAMMKYLGPRYGTLLLPLLSMAPVGDKLASMLGNRVTTVGGDETVSGFFVGAVVAIANGISGLSTTGLGGAIDTYVTFSKDKQLKAAKMDAKNRGVAEPSVVADVELASRDWAPPDRWENNDDAISLMMRGQAAKFRAFPDGSIPNPFVIQDHFESAVEAMLDVDRLEAEQKGEAFDPDAYPVDVPKPLDDILLPGLHLGFGGAQKNQTSREIYTNRLLCTLLNKLAVNWVKKEKEETFVVKFNDTTATSPDELMRAFVEAPGCKVSARPRLNTVSFGLGLCIKEDDNTWTNIPLGLCLRTGLEDERGVPTHSFLLHGGFNVDIEGPIFGVKKMTMQHHHAIDGLTGWYTNEVTDVPWLTEKVEFGDAPVYGEDVVRACRLNFLMACILNSVGTRMKLQWGGYGRTGVCLDSVGVVELALTGTTDAYPMMSNGRYYTHTVREAKSFAKHLEGKKDVAQVYKDDVKALIDAMLTIPNDVTTRVATSKDAARRVLRCMPPSTPFMRQKVSKEVLERIIAE